MIDKIPLVKLPRCCTCCKREILNVRPSRLGCWHPWACEVHLRLSDFSFFRIQCCLDCGLEVGPGHFYDLEMQVLRSDTVEIMCATLNQKYDILFDSGGSPGGLLYEADKDWDSFAEKHFPLNGREKERLLGGIKNLHVHWEQYPDGTWEGVGKGLHWPFPILGIVRYAKPTKDLSSFEVCSREELERMKNEQQV